LDGCPPAQDEPVRKGVDDAAEQPARQPPSAACIGSGAACDEEIAPFVSQDGLVCSIAAFRDH